jgi:glycosyltransferase involved in cell wall biosynthesis
MQYPSITVAICTWNRADFLAETLEGLLHLDLPKELDWELIIVNNNCTDHTDKIIDKFRSKLPLKSVFEVVPGLSNARNRAVHEARGDYIIWTDDDVTVEVKWIRAYLNSIIAHRESVVFGGLIIPDFQGNTPKWICNNLDIIGDAYARRELGQREFKLDPLEGAIPYGANFCIKTNVQKRFLFDPDYGFVAGKLVGGEETQVIRKILQTGEEGWWVPDAVVHHRIEYFRQSERYLYRYFRSQGSRTSIDSQEKGAGKCPRWVYRKWLQYVTSYLSNRIIFRDRLWIAALKGAALHHGMIDKCSLKLK